VVGHDGRLTLLDDFPTCERNHRLVVDDEKLQHLVEFSRSKNDARSHRVRAYIDRHVDAGFLTATKRVFESMNTPLALAPRDWRSEHGVTDSTLALAKA